jgi:hypothetical protein
VWLIPAEEMNKLLATEMDFLRSAGILRTDKVMNMVIREIMRVKDKPDITDDKKFWEKLSAYFPFTII